MGISEEHVLPEFIAITVPGKDRRGADLPETQVRDWVERFVKLVTSEKFRLGYRKPPKGRGGWPTGAYDPQTGNWVYSETMMEEDNHEIEVFCAADQFGALRSAAIEMLKQMGRDLDQDTVAYRTRKGLHTIKIK